MIKAVFITNIPSPYRVDFFAYLQEHYPEYEFHVIFSGAGMENRKWSVELAELKNAHFLKSKTIIIRIKAVLFWYSFGTQKSTNIQLFICFMILLISSLVYPSFSSSFRIALSLRPWLRRRAAL